MTNHVRRNGVECSIFLRCQTMQNLVSFYLVHMDLMDFIRKNIGTAFVAGT
jgi:hypothetical protein